MGHGHFQQLRSAKKIDILPLTDRRKQSKSQFKAELNFPSHFIRDVDLDPFGSVFNVSPVSGSGSTLAVTQDSLERLFSASKLLKCDLYFSKISQF